MQVSPVIAQAKFLAVGVATGSFALAMIANRRYLFTCTAACWIKQGVGAQTAAASTNGNLLVPANTPVLISGENGDTLAAIQDTAGGNATLCMVQV